MADNISTTKTTIAWLDSSLNYAKKDITAQEQLRTIDSNFRMLKNRNEYDEYMKSQPTDARVILIVNGALGQEIVPDIHSSAQISVIYVYCVNKAFHEKWALTYDKVKGVLTDFNDLRKLLPPPLPNRKGSIISSVSLDEVTEEPEEEPTETPILPISAPYELDGTYIISSSCFDYLAHIKNDPQEKDDFVSFCHEALKANEPLLALIREFQASYSPNQAISWLQREYFFPEFLKNIFRFANVESMYYCRIFIRDTQKQIVENKCTSATQVYRTVIIPDEEFEKLKTYTGKIIAMKIFMLTNSDREKALSWTADFTTINGLKRILFTIEANPQIENVKSFANIGSIGHNNDKNDVLFNIGSLFRMTEIEDEKDGVINIKLALCANEEMSQTRQLCDQLKLKYIDEKGETDVIGFGQFLFDFGKSMSATYLSDIGEKNIRSCFEKLSSGGDDDLDRLRCYRALGYIESCKDNFDVSLEWYKKAFDLQKEKSQGNDLNLVEIYCNLFFVSSKTKDCDQTLEYLQKLSGIYKQLNGDDCLDLCFCYTNMAKIYESKDNFTDALSCYYHTLAIMTKHKFPDEASYAALYFNFGQACTALKQYTLALGYYKAALEIKLKMNSSPSETVALTYRSIGYLYESMNDIPQAQTNLEKAVEIYRQLCSSDDAKVTELEAYIQNLSPTTNPS